MFKGKEGFLKGIMYLMFSQIIIKILGMIYSLYLTNKQGFGDDGNAISMYGFQIYALILGICSMGIPNVVSKMISENIAVGKNKNCLKILKISIIVFLILSFLFCLLLYNGAGFIANKILSISASKDILKILAPSIVFVTIEAVFRGFFNGMNKVSFSAKINTLEQVLKTIFTIIIVEKIGSKTNYNTELMAKGAMLAVSISTISSFMYSFILYKKIKEFKYEINEKTDNIIKILKELFILLLPISFTATLLVLENTIDSISIVRILKEKIGEVEARKIYGIITSKVNLIVGLPLALNGAVSMSLIPEISRNFVKNDKKKLEKNINISFIITILISVPIMFIAFFFSNEIMQILYPNAPKGAELLKLASITIVFSCLTQNISGILQGIGNSKTHLVAVACGMFVKFILNFILISNNRILEYGAIISTIISDMLIFEIMYMEFRRNFKIKFSFEMPYKLIKLEKIQKIPKKLKTI